MTDDSLTHASAAGYTLGSEKTRDPGLSEPHGRLLCILLVDFVLVVAVAVVVLAAAVIVHINIRQPPYHDENSRILPRFSNTPNPCR
jgi:hypothetical protein